MPIDPHNEILQFQNASNLTSFHLLGWSGTESIVTEATIGLLSQPWMMVMIVEQ
jgi:hypothetical protein